MDHRIGTITEVNTKTGVIVFTDKYGGQLRVSYHLQDGTVSIPKVGEEWMVKLNGRDWVLEKRIDSGKENPPITVMSPGDRRLYSPHDVFISADHTVYISGDNIQTSDIHANAITLGDSNNTKITGHYSQRINVGFPSIPGNFSLISSGGSETFVSTLLIPSTPFRITISGSTDINSAEIYIPYSKASVGDSVVCTPAQHPGAGLIWTSHIFADGIVAITMNNITNQTIEPPPGDWVIDIWKHEYIEEETTPEEVILVGDPSLNI